MFVLTMNLNYETIILSTMLGSDKRAANFRTFSRRVVQWRVSPIGLQQTRDALIFAHSTSFQMVPANSYLYQRWQFVQAVQSLDIALDSGSHPVYSSSPPTYSPSILPLDILPHFHHAPFGISLQSYLISISYLSYPFLTSNICGSSLMP